MLHPADIETYHGYVESGRDALILIEATLQGFLPTVMRRLRDHERALIRSGSIFIYNEPRSRIKRWTDGRAWSPSRVLTTFLVYRELDRKLPRPRNADVARLERYAVSENTAAPLILPTVTSSRNGLQFQEDGLIKKSFSVVLQGVPIHLISYYKKHDVITGYLMRPSHDTQLSHIQISPELHWAHHNRVVLDDAALPSRATTPNSPSPTTRSRSSTQSEPPLATAAFSTEPPAPPPLRAAEPTALAAMSHGPPFPSSFPQLATAGLGSGLPMGYSAGGPHGHHGDGPSHGQPHGLSQSQGAMAYGAHGPAHGGPVSGGPLTADPDHEAQSSSTLYLEKRCPNNTPEKTPLVTQHLSHMELAHPSRSNTITEYEHFGSLQDSAMSTDPRQPPFASGSSGIGSGGVGGHAGGSSRRNHRPARSHQPSISYAGHPYGPSYASPFAEAAGLGSGGGGDGVRDTTNSGDGPMRDAWPGQPMRRAAAVSELVLIPGTRRLGTAASSAVDLPRSDLSLAWDASKEGAGLPPHDGDDGCGFTGSSGMMGPMAASTSGTIVGSVTGSVAGSINNGYSQRPWRYEPYNRPMTRYHSYPNAPAYPSNASQDSMPQPLTPAQGSLSRADDSLGSMESFGYPRAYPSAPGLNPNLSHGPQGASQGHLGNYLRYRRMQPSSSSRVMSRTASGASLILSGSDQAISSHVPDAAAGGGSSSNSMWQDGARPLASTSTPYDGSDGGYAGHGPPSGVPYRPWQQRPYEASNVRELSDSMARTTIQYPPIRAEDHRPFAPVPLDRRSSLPHISSDSHSYRSYGYEPRDAMHMSHFQTTLRSHRAATALPSGAAAAGAAAPTAGTAPPHTAAGPPAALASPMSRSRQLPPPPTQQSQSLPLPLPLPQQQQQQQQQQLEPIALPPIMPMLPKAEASSSCTALPRIWDDTLPAQMVPRPRDGMGLGMGTPGGLGPPRSLFARRPSEPPTSAHMPSAYGAMGKSMGMGMAPGMGTDLASPGSSVAVLPDSTSTLQNGGASDDHGMYRGETQKYEMAPMGMPASQTASGSTTTTAAATAPATATAAGEPTVPLSSAATSSYYDPPSGGHHNSEVQQ